MGEDLATDLEKWSEGKWSVASNAIELNSLTTSLLTTDHFPEIGGLVNSRELDVAVYGIINAGKSSLINALAGREARSTGPIGGTTRDVAGVEWRVVESEDVEEANPSVTHHTIRLLDTPGLEEVGDSTRSTLATDAARKADLVLFVLSEDLTGTARRALVDLKEVGKPIVVALNKMDLLESVEQEAVLQAVRDGLAGLIPSEDVVPIAASPIVRRLVLMPEGGSKVETTRGEPEVEPLEARLLAVLAESASDLKALADVTGLVESHIKVREVDRAKLRLKAERVADESSAALAIALAVNPLPLLDFLAGPGGLTILVRRVSAVYGERLSAEVARGLARELIRGGRVVLWGSLAATIGGGAMKILPGLGHLAGALTQGASAGYFGHVVGRALVEYLDNGHDWGDGGLVALLDRIAASTDRKAVTKGLVDRIKARLKGQP
jgi:GTP-binding protein Era